MSRARDWACQVPSVGTVTSFDHVVLVALGTSGTMPTCCRSRRRCRRPAGSGRRRCAASSRYRRRRSRRTPCPRRERGAGQQTRSRGGGVRHSRRCVVEAERLELLDRLGRVLGTRRGAVALGPCAGQHLDVGRHVEGDRPGGLGGAGRRHGRLEVRRASPRGLVGLQPLRVPGSGARRRPCGRRSARSRCPRW